MSTGGPSYFHAVISEPLIGSTIADHIDKVASSRLDAPALVSIDEGVRLSYGELAREADRLAMAFLAAGLEKGDRIGIWSTNNSQWFVIFLAAARTGLILVNINPGYRTAELEYAINQSGLKMLFTIVRNRTSDYLAMLHEIAPQVFSGSSPKSLSRCAGLETIVVIDPDEIADDQYSFNETFLPFERFCDQAAFSSPEELEGRRRTVQFDSPVNIQYTSGTTGFPKGVTLSHHSLINNAYQAAVAMEIDRESRFCVPMPFYHCGGMISSALATLSVGGCVVIPSPFFTDLPTLKAVQSESCTHISGVPTMFIAQLEHPEFKSFDLSSLKGGFMAGAPCPVQLMRRVISEMHLSGLVILYGLTESSPLMTATTTRDSLEKRATTVGRAIPGVELKVIDTETGAVVERGAQGEICCRGHLVMMGYWQDEKATGDAIDRSGWLHSGDLGVMSEDGYLNITGRKKDMICRGGENVYPREIEEVLHTHDQISQAQVFGVPDHRLGEEVALWVMPKPQVVLDPEELKTWLKDRVAHFKVPRYIKIVEEFPLTVTGKPRKFVMRDQMIEELGLELAAEVETA